MISKVYNNILALDPAINEMGYGVFYLADSKTKTYLLVGYGLIKNEGSETTKLIQITEDIKYLIRKYDIDLIVHEEVIKCGFGGKNRYNSLSTNNIMYAVISSIRQAARELYLTEPLTVHSATVKKTIGGNGRAEKTTVRTGVNKLTGRSVINLNISDSLAVGLTYIIKNGLGFKVQQ